LVQIINIAHQQNLESILDLWKGLHGRLSPDNPFNSPEWSGIILNSQKASYGQRLLAAISEEHGKEAVLPLWVHCVFQFGLPSRRVESIGIGSSPTRRHRVYVQEPLVVSEAWNLLLNSIRALGGWNLFRLAPLPKNSPTIKMLDRISSDHNLIFFRRPYATGFKIVISGRNWRDYKKSRSKKFLKGIRSAIKKLKNHAGFVIETYQKSEDRNKMIEAILAISKNSWKADIGTDLFNKNNHGFFRMVLTHYIDAGKSAVWVLYDNKRPIAFEWHLRHNGRSIALKADYDKAYAFLSPGNVVAWHACKSCFETGFDEVDYLFGGSAYKKRWATDVYLLEEVILFKKDPYSRIVHEAFKRRHCFEKLWSLNRGWRLQRVKK